MKYYIAGYSLEACVMAAKLRAGGADVVFHKTGAFAPMSDITRSPLMPGVYDELRPLVRNIEELVAVKYDYLHYYADFESLKITNDLNGMVKFPLRRASFGTESEWISFSDRVGSSPDIVADSAASSNALFVYKKCLPRPLFDSLFKNHGASRWCGVINYDANALADEIPFADAYHTGMYASHVPHSYESLCEELLNGIDVVDVSLDDLRKELRRKRRDPYAICDNRVDYICEHVHGRLDRVVYESDDVQLSESPEFACVKSGIALVTDAEYWLSTRVGRDGVRRVRSTKAVRLSNPPQSVLIPSVSNMVRVESYTKHVECYGGKMLALPKSMTLF